MDVQSKSTEAMTFGLWLHRVEWRSVGTKQITNTKQLQGDVYKIIFTSGTKPVFMQKNQVFTTLPISHFGRKNEMSVPDYEPL